MPETLGKADYKYIIWDWNGTLLNDVWLCVEMINRVLVENHLKVISVEEYVEIFDFPVKLYYEKIGFDFSKESFEKVGTDFIRYYNLRHYECDLHKGAVATLEKLKNRGIGLSLLSAREEKDLLEELKNRKINHYFERISGLNDHYADGKTENGKKLIKELGLKHHEVVFIGDTIHDAEVAKSIGADCILIANGHQTKERLLATGVPVIDTIDQVTSIL